MNSIIIPTAGFSQTKINMRVAICYFLAGQAGYDIVPEISGDTITFPGLPVDVETFLTIQIYDDTFAAWEAQQAQQAADDAAEAQALTDELETNPLSNITLADAIAYIDDMTTVAQLKTGLKVLVKYIVSKRV